MERYHLPPPRGDRSLRDSLVASLADWSGTVLRWGPVTAAGYGTWMGASLPELGWTRRPWVLDVTGPGESGGDPLALEVERDLVAVTVADPTRRGVRARMVADLPAGRTELHVPATAWPPAPWTVDLDVGWSTAAITAAVGGWVAQRAARPDVLVVTDDAPAAPTVELGGLVRATDVAFDGLLALDPGDAALICATLGAIADALGA